MQDMTEKTPRYAIGLDYGTESARAVLADASDGTIVATAVTEYPHGVMDHQLPDGTPLGHEWALQHPQDYLDVMTETVKTIVADGGVSPEQVIGIGVDFTACTILPTDEENIPLCFSSEFAAKPHAWVKLWKHHAAQPQADRINEAATDRGEKWLKVYGYRLSSEWVLPKVLQVIEEAPDVYAAAANVVEAGDWLIQHITGSRVRSSCNAGYKACYVKGEGYPSSEFLASVHPDLVDLYTSRMSGDILAPGDRAGELTVEWAERLGLRGGTPVAVEIIDAHAAVPGCGVCEEDEMVLAMGTSTCHMLMSNNRAFVPGVGGVIEDGILPGFFGYEAGQAAVGDHFAWAVRQGLPDNYVSEAKQRGISEHDLLTEKAAAQRPGEHGLLALDWWNGNRSILMDADLSGVIVGMSLATRPEDIYRALIEATAFGTRVIIEEFERHGVAVRALVGAGGLVKNEMLMQIYSDVLGRPIRVASSEHTCALGSAILGAVAAGGDGGYDSLREATSAMVSPSEREFVPEPHAVEVYTKLYAEYAILHDYFGKGENDVMKRLRQIRATATGASADE
jgi:L-ribulokinase